MVEDCLQTSHILAHLRAHVVTGVLVDDRSRAVEIKPYDIVKLRRLYLGGGRHLPGRFEMLRIVRLKCSFEGGYID